MILIGSRAIKYHFKYFRQPNDYDFIATKAEIAKFLADHPHQIKPSNPKKVVIKLNQNNKIFEFEKQEEILSSQKISELTHQLYFDSKLNLQYQIPSPELLFILKKSHICFNINWMKNAKDYLFLKSRIKPISKELEEIFNLRFQETKERIKFKNPNFNISNSDFFKASAHAVNRFVPHDSLHYATCFFDKPLFLSVKDDLSKAEMSQAKVEALPHELKIKLIQEEIMALSLERKILPAIKDKKSYNRREIVIDTAAKMVYNYLPLYLRFFAIDNFLEIIDLKFDFVDKFFKNSNLTKDNL